MTSDLPLKKLSGSGRFKKVAKIALGWGRSPPRGGAYADRVNAELHSASPL